VPNIKNNASSQETRRKLLAGAGATFAAKGLHAATIRQITDAAGVNMAAVNYHFRDKSELYDEVLREAYRQTFGAMLEVELPPGTPEHRLHAYILSLLQCILSPARPAWESALLAREINRPEGSLGTVLRDGLRENALRVQALLREILGTNVSDDVSLAALACVFGQCLFFLQQREYYLYLFPDTQLLSRLPRLADLITANVLHGLPGMLRLESPAHPVCSA
jgi:AcrR family transcriptional regulator